MTTACARTSVAASVFASRKRMPHTAPDASTTNAEARKPVTNAAPFDESPSRSGVMMLSMSPNPRFGNRIRSDAPAFTWSPGFSNWAPYSSTRWSTHSGAVTNNRLAKSRSVMPASANSWRRVSHACSAVVSMPACFCNALPDTCMTPVDE